MAYNPKAIQDLKQQLEALMNQAALTSCFSDVISAATALEALKAWQVDGGMDDLPAAVRQVKGINLPAAVETPPAASSNGAPSSEPAAPPFAPPFDPPSGDDKLAPAFSEALRRVRAAVEDGRIDAARGQLDALHNMVSSEAERSALTSVLQRYEEQRLIALEQALKGARAAQRRSVSVHEQRAAWEAVVKLDPNLPEAVDALRSLQSTELAQVALEQLSSIQRRLSEIRYNLKQINEERAVVERLRYDRLLIDAGRLPEVEMLLKQLNEMREDAQRKSDGGASSELSGDYERAFAVFRQALRDGYRVIANDRTGEVIEVEPSLLRVREKYFQQQIKRTDERFNDAKAALADGNPEVAVSRLSEALAILQPVESPDGINWRAEVDKLLDQAKQEQEAKQRANQLVEDARNADEVRRARELLQQARTTYPKFPQIDILIADTQDRIVRVVLNDLHINLESAATYLRGGRYELARQVCEKAVRAGEKFSFLDANEEYRRLRTQAQELLTRIGVAEVHAKELQQKINDIQAALDTKNLRLAQRLLDQIDAADLADPRVSRLSTDLALQRSDAEIMAAAEKAFDNQLYEQVVELCAKLQEGDGLYAQNARQLQRRAGVRLSLLQAGAAQEAGRLDEAAEQFKKAAAPGMALPPEDNALVEQAQAALRAMSQERKESEKLERELKSIKEHRLYDRWAEWRQGLVKLRERTPELFYPSIDAELSNGMQDWRQYVQGCVEDLYHGENSDWSKLYELLLPFARAGGIVAVAERNRQPSDEESVEDLVAVVYRQAALRKYEQQALSYEQIGTVSDLQIAVELRRNAYNMASPPALAERRRLVDTLRLWVERQAEQAAAISNPEAAVKALLDNMDKYVDELKSDPLLHQRVIYYALLARKFELAEREAAALQFLVAPEQREAMRGWQQLVAAASHFADSDMAVREQGVRELAQLRDAVVRQANPGSAATGYLVAVVEESVTQQIDSLYAEASGSLRRLSNEDILYRVRVYDLILQLRRDDQRARDGVTQLADHLNRIGQELTEKARQLLSARSSGDDAEVKQLETVNDELRAILQAYILLNQMTTPIASQLAKQHEQARQRLQQQRDLKKLLDELDGEWKRALSVTWDVKSVRSLLQSIRNLSRQGNAVDLTNEETRAAQADETFARLREHLKQISVAWDTDDFSTVLQQIEQFNIGLGRARRELEQELVMPANLFVVNDKQRQTSLTQLNEVRQVTQDRQQNLTEWESWQNKLNALLTEVTIVYTAAETHLNAQPPNLTEGRKALQTLIKQYRMLLEHLEKMPKEVLSAKAEKCAGQARTRDMKPKVEQEISTAEQRLAETEEHMKQVEEPVLRLKRWRATRGLDLTRDANRRILQRMVEEVKKIDAGHPEIQRQEDDYQRITKRPLS